MEKSIPDQVKEIIADKLAVNIKEVTPEKSFTNDLGADSLDRVELVMELEQTFKIAITDEEAEKLLTVGEAVSFVETHIKK